MSLTLGELFNENFYLERNPDVADAIANGTFSSAFEHFSTFGKFEGRAPSIVFNSGFYFDNNPNLAFEVALDDYIQFGQFENRDPSILFDADFYLQNNPDVAALVGPSFSAIAHFLRNGQFEGRAPSAGFADPSSYIANNPDVEAAVAAGEISAIAHYINFGAAEGRPFNPVTASGRDPITGNSGKSLLPAELLAADDFADRAAPIAGGEEFALEIESLFDNPVIAPEAIAANFDFATATLPGLSPIEDGSNSAIAQSWLF